MATDTGFSRPTLQQLIDRIGADFDTRLPGVDSKLRRSVIYVLARVLAGLSHNLYGYLDFIARQAIIDTAVVEYLERWAAIWGVSRKASDKATGTINLTGTDGSIVNIGTVVRRSDEVEYTTTTAVTITSGTATPSVEAVEPGTGGNADSGTVLTFVSPVDGVDATATSNSLTGGVDSEADDALRGRLLTRIQQPPHGGASFDYTAWALEVEGVTRAWVFPQELAENGVTVRFTMDDTYDDGIPLSGDVDEVQDYIDARRPVTADVTVVAPIAVELDFTIHLKDASGTTVTDPTIRAEVEAELEDMILRDAEPGGTIFLSRINEAISIAAGEYDHTMSSPAADVTHSTGEIAVMGTITWSA